MLKFLGNDFTLERWKTAALKNAYALLSKNRYGESDAKGYWLRAEPDLVKSTRQHSSCWQINREMRSISASGSWTTGNWRSRLRERSSRTPTDLYCNGS